MERRVTDCDMCEAEITGSVNKMWINYGDRRRGTKKADLCDACADKLPGRPAARRGRPPKVRT